MTFNNYGANIIHFFKKCKYFNKKISNLYVIFCISRYVFILYANILYFIMVYESGNEMCKRVIRDLMHATGYDSVQEFADKLDVGYMTVYNPYSGRVSRLSDELISVVKEKFPEVNETYLMTGTGNILINNKQTHNDPTLTNDDMFRLLERITTLLERVQMREERLTSIVENVTELQNKLASKILSSNE